MGCTIAKQTEHKPVTEIDSTLNTEWIISELNKLEKLVGF